MSDAQSYCFSTSEISGALYHLVPTWLDKLLTFSTLVTFQLVNFCAIISLNAVSPLMWLRSLFNILSRILLEFPEPLPMQLLGKVLERPKSQSLMLQSSSIRMFAGFRSRCKTLEECKKRRAQSILYKIFQYPVLSLRICFFED